MIVTKNNTTIDLIATVIETLKELIREKDTVSMDDVRRRINSEYGREILLPSTMKRIHARIVKDYIKNRRNCSNDS